MTRHRGAVLGLAGGVMFLCLLINLVATWTLAPLSQETANNHLVLIYNPRTAHLFSVITMLLALAFLSKSRWYVAVPTAIFAGAGFSNIVSQRAWSQGTPDYFNLWPWMDIIANTADVLMLLMIPWLSIALAVNIRDQYNAARSARSASV